jgi:hypothetical protein
LFPTPHDAWAMPFTITVETKPLQLGWPQNLATRFQKLLTNSFGLSAPIVCSWIGGRFYLAIDSTNDTAELERLNGAGVLPFVRVMSHNVGCVHFHVSIPTGAARADRKTATAD